MKSVKANVSFPKMEEELLEVWNSDRTFYKSNDKRKSDGKKEFTFYDGLNVSSHVIKIKIIIEYHHLRPEPNC